MMMRVERRNGHWVHVATGQLVTEDERHLDYYRRAVMEQCLEREYEASCIARSLSPDAALFDEFQVGNHREGRESLERQFQEWKRRRTDPLFDQWLTEADQEIAGWGEQQFSEWKAARASKAAKMLSPATERAAKRWQGPRPPK